MTTNCASDILKPFQSILNALASRKKSAECREAAGNAYLENEIRSAAGYVDGTTRRLSDSSRRLQTIRTRTTRPFRIWDRLRESLSCPENMALEMQTLAQCISNTIKPEELDTPLEACGEPPKSAAALARAKTTSTRLRVLEAYLEGAEQQAV